MSVSALGRLGNILSLLGANALGRVLTLLYVALVARALGPEGFGQLATVTAYLAIFGVVADFGVTTVTVRDVVREPWLGPAYLRASLALRGGLAVAAFGGLVLAGWAAGYPAAQQRYFWIAGLALLPLAVTGACTALLTARERIARVAALHTLGAAVTLAAAGPVVAAGGGVTGLLLLLVAVQGLQALVSGWWVLRTRPAGDQPEQALPGSAARLAGAARPEGTPLGAAAWRLLRRAWPYGCFALLSMVHLRVAAIVLSVVGGSEAVGLYNAAFKLVEALTVIPAALMGGLFPLMAAQSGAGATGPLGDTYRRAVRVLGLLALPLAVGTTLLAGPIVGLVYGPRYAAAGPVLAVLSWGLALLFLNAPVGQVIFSADRGRPFLPWACLNTGGYAALTVLLAVRFGILGAAVAFAVAEATGCAIQLRFVRATVGRLPAWPAILWRPALAAALMGAALAGLARLGAGLPLLGPAGALIYAAMLALLGEVRREDRARLRAWLLRARPVPGGPVGS